MSQKIEIKEIIPPKTDKSPTILKDAKGGTFSGFDKKLSGLSLGTVIEAEIVVDGQYNNIKEWKLVEEGASPGTPASDTPADAQAQAASIIAQLWIAGKLTEDSDSVRWLIGWLPTKQLPVGAIEQKTEGTKSFEELFSEAGEEPATIQELLQYVASHGRLYNRTWLINELGIEDSQLARDPNAYYHAIKEKMGW